MNGVHDMGGMTGLGELGLAEDDPLFHARWEARTFAMCLAMGSWRKWNGDASRFQKEIIPGPAYLAMTYYERWFTGLVGLSVGAGLISEAEAQSGVPAAGTVKQTPPLTAERVEEVMHRPPRHLDATGRLSRFAVGDVVRARNFNPPGHTRLPRYARGKTGRIEHARGLHSFPDTNAHGLGPQPQPLYSVRFTARELWGEEASPVDAVYLDLWESYLEAAA